MQRLTKADWQIINAALGRYEAEDEEDRRHSDEAIAATRQKVFERLAD